MTVDEIVRKERGKHYGYQLSVIAISTLKLEDLSNYRHLKRIPPKITAFLNRAKIKAVFKSDHSGDPLDDYYLVRATDDTLFILEY